MCIAIPGRVTKVTNEIAEVDFSGNTISAWAGLVNTKEGDYVLVHAGCILQIVNEQEAQEIFEFWGE